MWRSIETLPPSGQVLVTDDELPFDPGPGYGTIDLAVCPMLSDGRLLSQNSANYTRPGTWKWWHPVPSREVSSSPRYEDHGMQGDTLLLKKKLDDATTAMKLANEPPYAVRTVELTYSEMMLIWTALDLRDAIRDVTK